MINNRQNGRRGRGRGNNGSSNGGIRPMGGQDRGNRIDNRARGNANQLHEKYKTLARDAQTQGDRVMTEYYLQFADHYFRVLAETRGRFDEQRPQQRRDFGDDYDGDEGEGDDALAAEGGQQDREPRRDRDYRRDDRPRDDRQQDGRQQDNRQQDARSRDDRGQDDRQQDRQQDGRPQQDGRRANGYHSGNGQDNRGQDNRGSDNRGQDGRDREPRYERRDRDDRAAGANGGYPPAPRAEEPAEPEFRAEGDASEQPRRARGRPRRERPVETAEAGADRLNPPSFLTEAMPPLAPPPVDDGGEDAPAPRRRVRRPRAETGEAAAEV